MKALPLPYSVPNGSITQEEKVAGNGGVGAFSIKDPISIKTMDYQDDDEDEIEDVVMFRVSGTQVRDVY